MTDASPNATPSEPPPGSASGSPYAPPTGCDEEPEPADSWLEAAMNLFVVAVVWPVLAVASFGFVSLAWLLVGLVS